MASYKTVASADSGRDEVDIGRRESSDTEVGDSLIGDDEKQWETIALERARKTRGMTSGLSSTASKSRVGRSIAFLRYHRWAVDTGLLVIILGLVVLLQLEVRSRPSRWQVGGDYTAAGPVFSTKVIKWEADEAFVPTADHAFFSNETTAQWNTLMPAGTGWRHTEDETTFFTTTMTHQLHCIFMMARIYSSLRAGQSEGSQGLPEDYHSHYLHCIDYLRQATMCAGDVAVEAHEPDDADDNGPLDGGWSGHHVCKDYSQVTSYLEGQIRDGVRTVLPIDD
ncbi:hypothetical protein F503_06886 [Ophiostoma piceae UAMH 11346]|uniref:Oxidase ustYa n=1 Tax=Ophiostoma piceae (strain UAMH 11346) TaxID=1262450 RepID=S3D6S5_OPHP1|nr:hypothetical protein F503_06886 [Ophiostoma piceae UAMH 11346]